uniref:Uncharacterized protein n=1 Tax=Romanomermis culicivorax TaxID=13658 RepID=A0A915KBC0_ROMCU
MFSMGPAGPQCLAGQKSTFGGDHHQTAREQPATLGGRSFFRPQRMQCGHSRQQICIDGRQKGKSVLEIDSVEQTKKEMELAVWVG